MEKSLILIFVVFAVCLTQTPPVFPNQYELDFTEKSSIGPLSGNTTGTIYLDAKNDKQLVTRKNGHHDRYCGSVYKFSDTACNHYVSGGKRYLDFPEKKYCCFCCDGTHGCGITSPDWLVKSNATYKGSQKLEDGQLYVKWEIKGLQDNLYYHQDDALKTPRRLYQVSDDLMDFTGYRTSITDSSVFTVPSYCKDTCGITTICAALRGDKFLQREQ